MRRRKISIVVPIVLFAQMLSPALILGDPASAEYIVLAPKKLYLGTESSVSVSSFSSGTGKPIDRQIVLSLVKAGDTGQGIKVFEGRTGPDGHLIARFHVPPVDKGAYSFVLTSPGNGESIRGDIVVADALTLLIETDKPIYKPGQTIHGRVLALNADLKPVSVGLNLSISDSKGVKIFRKELTTDSYGVASFDLALADELNLGTWKITANAPTGMATVDIRVEKYVLPKFGIEVVMPRDWFLVDESIAGEVRANYFFGKPVDGMVEVRAYKYVAQWEEFATFRGQLSGGAVQFEIPRVGYLVGTVGSGGLGSVILNVSVIDGSGHEERDSQLLKIAGSPTVVQIIPSGEIIKPGLPLDVLIVTETPGGEPLDKRVQLTATYYMDDGSTSSEEREVTTFKGIAMADLNVPGKCASANLAASVKEDGAQVEISLRSAYSPAGYFVHIKQSSPGEVRVGDSVTFEVLSTSKRTVYYDVVAGGRTVYSGFTTGRYISFKVTPKMVPKAKLVAYVINPNNEVSADSLPFDVGLETGVTLSASFSAETSAPGESVVIDLQSSSGIATMIGISVVDESVYALNEGRLNLRQIFDELEKIFMAPQAEAHPEGGPFWWGPVTMGAKDVFDDAGVQVITSKSIDIPEGSASWFIRFRGGGIDVLAEAAKDANQQYPTTSGGQGLAEVQRVRQFFPETWYWNPSLLTDPTGHATIRLDVPDSITTWRLHAVSSSQEGIGIAETSLKVFQDFFVEPDLPYAVTRGEEFPVIVQIYNYLATSQTVQVEIAHDAWFELLDERVKVGVVPGNSVAAVAFTIRPTRIGQFKLEITARTNERADAVRRDILIEAEGTPREIVQNGFITQTEPRKFDLSLPDGIIEDSGRILLSITPSLVGQTINGVEDLLGIPFGCGEQNMMFMAPDLEILRYLDSTGQIVPEIRAKAEHFLITGYQRELTFRRNDGSFSAFGQSDQEGSLWLTAFVLDVFSEAREVLSIDETVLAQAVQWIESHQNSNGSWSPVGFVCHREMMGGLNPEAKSALTAFVAIALADYGDSSGDASLAKAIAYLEEHALDGDDVYALAVSSLLLEKVGSPKAEEAVSRLLEKARTDENGMYWSSGQERSNAIETTAYAALALMLEERSEAESAIRWIASQRNSLGGFSSTQDTVMALKALMTAARLQSRNINSAIDVVVDGTTLARIELTESNFDVLQIVGIPLGARELELQMSGEGKVLFQLAKRFNIPGEVAANPEFFLGVEYNTTNAAVNDIVEVVARVRYNGLYNSTGMMILDIAVPTGFVPVQSTLDEVVSQGLASRVEVAGRKVIFYVDDLERGREIRIKFSILALFPVKALGGTSKAYSYYKPNVRTEAAGPRFEVKGEVPSRFGPEVSRPEPGGEMGVVGMPASILPMAFLAIVVGCLAVASAARLIRGK